MKRKSLSFILFVAAFVVTYLIICFGIPGMRLKLEAEPAEFFLASIKHMALFKSMVSLVVGIIFGVLPILKKRNNNISKFAKKSTPFF